MIQTERCQMTKQLAHQHPGKLSRVLQNQEAVHLGRLHQPSHKPLLNLQQLLDGNVMGKLQSLKNLKRFARQLLKSQASRRVRPQCKGQPSKAQRSGGAPNLASTMRQSLSANARLMSQSSLLRTVRKSGQYLQL